MWVNANIKVLGTVTEGTSQATGNSYKMQNIILEWSECDFEGKPVVDATGKTVTSLAQFSLGTKRVEELAALQVQCYGWVLADVRVRTKQYQKRDGSWGVMNEMYVAAFRPMGQ